MGLKSLCKLEKSYSRIFCFQPDYPAYILIVLRFANASRFMMIIWMFYRA